MASRLRTTEFTHLKASGASFTITLDQATTAGSTLVFAIGGGAIAQTVRITNSSGATFTKRTAAYTSGAFDTSIFDFVAVGGETTVHVTLNGAENVAGCVHEFAGLGSFIDAGRSNQENVGSGTNNQIICPDSVAVSGNAVLVAMFTRDASLAVAPYNDSNRFHQFGPAGQLVADGANQPGIGGEAQLIWATGVADVTSSGRYPYNEATGNYSATSTVFDGGNSYVCQAVYANAGANVNPTVSDTVRENSLPGDLSLNWLLTSTDQLEDTIAGYTDKASYAVGDTVNFKVDSTTNPFQVEIYRLGYYGDEAFAARKVGQVTGTPASQSTPSVDGTTGATTCAWSTTASWAMPTDCVPGVYWFLMRRTDNTAEVAGGHFVVRGDPTGKITFVLPDLTYQAYNMWGATSDVQGTLTGRSLYGANGTPNNTTRAYAVSWDRPMATAANVPQTYLFDQEAGFICFAEAQGYDMTYLSDIDLEVDKTLLTDASLVLMVGHHEYWTTNVYDAYEDARDAGVNFMICASNVALWRVRFAAGDTNKRTMICYKDSITRDSAAGFTGTGYDPVTPTGTWRDALSTNGIANPDRRPENTITGQLFIGNGAIQEPGYVPFASKSKPIWRNSTAIQALTTGQSYETTGYAIMGYEMEYPASDSFTPPNMVILNPHTANYAGKGANANGTIYNGATGDITVGFTMYRASNGALVFNTGSWRGFISVSRRRLGGYTSGGTVSLDWQNALLAIMYDLGARHVALKPMQSLVADSALTEPATGAPGPTRNDVAIAYGLTVTNTGFSRGFFALIN